MLEPEDDDWSSLDGVSDTMNDTGSYVYSFEDFSAPRSFPVFVALLSCRCVSSALKLRHLDLIFSGGTFRFDSFRVYLAQFSFGASSTHQF